MFRYITLAIDQLWGHGYSNIVEKELFYQTRMRQVFLVLAIISNLATIWTDWFTIARYINISSILMFSLFLYFDLKRRLPKWSSLIPLVLACVHLCALYYVQGEIDIPVWFMLLPLPLALLLSFNRGFSLSLLFWVAVIIIQKTHFHAGLSFGVMLEEVVVFYFLYFSGVVVENIRSQRQKEVDQLNSILEESVDSLRLNAIRMEKRIVRDELTNLFNRRHFDIIRQQWITQAYQNKSGLVLLMIDVDYFKKFNDTYGHPAGDEVLQEVAEVLQNCIRDQSDAVFRYGGEEFSILMQNAGLNEGEVVARRILQRFVCEEIPHEYGIKGRVSVSIGVSYWSWDAGLEKAGKLVHNADEALYKSKQSGRNQYQIIPTQKE